MTSTQMKAIPRKKGCTHDGIFYGIVLAKFTLASLTNRASYMSNKWKIFCKLIFLIWFFFSCSKPFFIFNMLQYISLTLHWNILWFYGPAKGRAENSVCSVPQKLQLMRKTSTLFWISTSNLLRNISNLWNINMFQILSK